MRIPRLPRRWQAAERSRSGAPSGAESGRTVTPIVSQPSTGTEPSATEGSQQLPRHIAVIMDGNGRWAEQRRMPRFAGHKAGADTVKAIVEYCGELGVEALTLFAFSSENWRRPRKRWAC